MTYQQFSHQDANRPSQRSNFLHEQTVIRSGFNGALQRFRLIFIRSRRVMDFFVCQSARKKDPLIDRATGRIVNANIADYHVPVDADVPDIGVFTVDAPDLATGALGAKGTGELPMVGVAQAIANAMFRATGKRVRKPTIRVEDVLA